MANNTINYKITFKESDKTLDNIISKLKNITKSSGVTLSDSFKGDLQKLDILLPSYKKKLEKVLSSSNIEVFDLKALTKEFNAISNLAKKMLTNLSKQILPKSVSDQIEALNKQITEDTSKSKILGGELVSRKNRLVKDSSGNYVDLTSKEKNRIVAKELGSITIGTDVLVGYDQLIAKKKELEASNKKETSEWREVTAAIENADAIISKHKTTLEQEIQQKEEERRAIIASREAKRDELNNLSTSTAVEKKLTSEQQKSLQDISHTLIDIDNANSTYNSGLEEVTESQEKNTKAVVVNNKEEIKKTGTLKRAATQIFTYGTALRLMRALYQELITTVTKMDEALTGMAVVTNMSREQTYELVGELQNLANATGMATTEIANMATKYYQQGKSTQQVIQLTEAAAKAATIAGISGEESINLLTNAMNGFQMSASQAMEVSDRFAALAAASATDYEELATALSKVAAQANLAGMSMDFTLGLIAKGIEVTREAPETIGTSLKTVIARMRELTDYGSTLEDGMDVNRVAKAFANIGVEMMDEEGQFRDLEDVLTEVGQKWDTLTTNQKANVAVAAAGTRQQSRFIAMMQDFDRTLELVNISANSYGATLAQQAKYMEGIEAKTTLMKNAFQKAIMEISNSDVIIGVIELITNALEHYEVILGALITTGIIWLGIKTATIIVSTKEIISTGLLTAAKYAEAKATYGAAAANIAYIATNPAAWILLMVAALGALVIGLSFYIVSMDDATDQTQKNIDKVAELQIEIYELSNTAKNLEQLADSFEDISNKVIKTEEDIQNLKETVQQFNDQAGMEIIDVNADYQTQLSQMRAYSSYQNKKIEDKYNELNTQAGKTWSGYGLNTISTKNGAAIGSMVGAGAGGIASGVAIGATVGSIIPGLGTLFGAIAGLIGGAVGAAVGAGLGAAGGRIQDAVEFDKRLEEARQQFMNDPVTVSAIEQMSKIYVDGAKTVSTEAQEIIGNITASADAIVGYKDEMGNFVSGFMTEDGFDFDAFNESLGENFAENLDNALKTGSLSEYKKFFNELDEQTKHLLSNNTGLFSGMEKLTDTAVKSFDSLGLSIDEVNSLFNSLSKTAKTLNKDMSELLNEIFAGEITKEEAYTQITEADIEAYKKNQDIVKGKDTTSDQARAYIQAKKDLDEAQAIMAENEYGMKNDWLEVQREGHKEKYDAALTQATKAQEIIDSIEKDTIDWEVNGILLGIQSVSDLTEEITSLSSTIERLNKVTDLSSLSFQEQMQLLADYPELYEAMQDGIISVEDQEKLYQNRFNETLESFKTNKKGLVTEFQQKSQTKLTEEEILKLTKDDTDVIKNIGEMLNLNDEEAWKVIEGYQNDLMQNDYAISKLTELGPLGLMDAENKQLWEESTKRTSILRNIIEENNKVLDLFSKESDKYKEIQNNITQNSIELIDELEKENKDISKKMNSILSGNIQDENDQDIKYKNEILKWEDFYDIINGKFVVNMDKLNSIEDEALKKLIEDDLKLAMNNFNIYSSMIEENKEEILELYNTLSESMTEQASSDTEKIIDELEKRKEAYEDYFDKIDQLEEEESNNQDRESLLKQIQSLSGATDSASKQKLKELKEELVELNEESINEQREQQRNEILESIDNQINSEQEKLDDINEGVSYISTLLLAGNKEELVNMLRNIGINEDQIDSYISALYKGLVLSEAITEEEAKKLGIPGYSTGGQVTHTGLALVHGTVTNPEAFLSAEDNITIKTLLSVLNSIRGSNSSSDILEDKESIIIENITIQTSQLNDNQDFKAAGRILAEEFAKAARKRGINQNVKK